jgi:hypothetical protein
VVGSPPKAKLVGEFIDRLSAIRVVHGPSEIAALPLETRKFDLEVNNVADLAQLLLAQLVGRILFRFRRHPRSSQVLSEDNIGFHRSVCSG